VEFVNGLKRLISFHDWAIDGYPFASRSQIPLRLSYAITIHKSQGSTLDCALVDVGMGTFEYGQAYVALSRITSLEALYIHEFDPRAFRVHPKVRAFYNQLAATLGAQQSVKTVSLDCQTAAQQSLDCQTASLETSPVTPSSCTDSVASIP